MAMEVVVDAKNVPTCVFDRRVVSRQRVARPMPFFSACPTTSDAVFDRVCFFESLHTRP